MTAADLNTAKALLEAMGFIQAGRILANQVDFNEFLSTNRLNLEEAEIRDLKAYFRV